MNNNLLDIKKTKYRYFMDNLKLFPIKPIIKYTVPVPNDPTVDESKQEFFDRKYPDVTITNVKFKNMIDKTAKALVALGIKKGDIVTICHTNTPEMFCMDYALSKIGAIPNYIYPNVTADEMKYYIDELNSKYMFILDDDMIRKNVKEVLKNTDIKVISSSPIESFPSLFKFIAKKKNGESKVFLNNEIKWEEFIKNGKNTKVKEASFEPNTVATYIHSSGTSSIPKAIMMSNENLNCVPHNYEVDGITFDPKFSVIQTIPLFVSYGLGINQLMFCNNICSILIPEMEPKNLYDLVKKYQSELCYATPSHARELIKRPVNMKNAYLYGFGGDGFDDVEEKVNSYIKENGGNSVSYQGWGASETSSIATLTSPIAHKLGSVGKLSGDTKVVLIKPNSDDGNIEYITEPNEVGEACVTGPGVTLGYAGESKKETKNVYVKHPDGKTYIHMGDYISFDEDGFYYYHGRIKNVITRKSFTFSPNEIKDVIMKHPDVKQCCVIPKYSKEEGETPIAHIILKDDKAKEKVLSEIISMVDENVQEFHRPTDYIIRDSLPITRNKKIDFNAFKIEETARMFYGVVDAIVAPQTNGEYDYVLDVIFNSNIDYNETTIENDIIKYIDDISKILKFKVGKIKTNINYVNITYKDDRVKNKNENNYNYVKSLCK